MSTADAMVSSSSRAVRLRVRPDLVVQRHRYLGRSYWVVKEPVSLKYFRFQEEEFAVLNMLDGRTSLDEIKRRFEAKFRPQKMLLADLHQFIVQLHRSGLVISEAAGQGRSLHQRSGEVRRREWLQRATSVLAMRFKGIDPQWLLDRGYPLVRWLFHPITVALCIALAISALALVTVQFDTFQQRLPTFHQFFGPRNWLMLACVLAITKILHEFGHGFSCKHFGGECHEIGVMLLVLTPCLYCNVSDSWLLKNKWHRAAIGAAGMYVELMLASVATFVWWFAQPETLVSQVALQVMFICSVSTILFNGNPLLRYDGYYILSDILEIPNLRQKSSQILQRFMATWCLGLEMPENPFLPQRNRALFALYTVASSLYRWVVVFSILLFLNKVFEPYGLKVLGQLIAMVSLFGLVVMPLYQLARFMYVPGRLDQVKRKNVLITAGVAAVLLGFVFLVPLPHRVKTTVEIGPRDSEPVFVKVPGTIDRDGVLVQTGEQVTAGQPLVRLVNLDLQFSLADLTGRRDEQEALLQYLQFQRTVDPQVSSEIPEAIEALQTLNDQIEEKRQDLTSLEIKAPVSGTVLAAAARPHRPSGDGQLAAWHGSPLEKRNEGTYVDESVRLCEIGDPAKAEAVLVIDQSSIDLVTVGQPVRIKLDAYTGKTLTGEIVEIAENDLDVASPGMSQQAGGTLPTRSDASGVLRPLRTSYLARVPLDNSDGELIAGMRGQAKVSTTWTTLGQRAWRWAMQTFRFQM